MMKTLKQKKTRKSKLKMCPFCGHAPIAESLVVGFVQRCVNPKCKVKPCTQPQKTEKKAILVWNSRNGDGKKVEKMKNAKRRSSIKYVAKDEYGGVFCHVYGPNTGNAIINNDPVMLADIISYYWNRCYAELWVFEKGAKLRKASKTASKKFIDELNLIWNIEEMR